MKKLSPALLLATSLLLVGAGCGAATNSSPKDESKDAPASSAQSSSTTEMDTKDSDATTLDAATTDDTWKTYTNAALGFEFKWPTKGLYAPQWEVKFEKEGSADIVEGCHAIDAAEGEKVSANGTEFCRNGKLVQGTSIDSYTTKIGSTYVVIAFTKTAPKGTEATYSWEEYSKTIDGIVGTFQKK